MEELTICSFLIGSKSIEEMAVFFCLEDIGSMVISSKHEPHN